MEIREILLWLVLDSRTLLFSAALPKNPRFCCRECVLTRNDSYWVCISVTKRQNNFRTLWYSDMWRRVGSIVICGKIKQHEPCHCGLSYPFSSPKRLIPLSWQSLRNKEQLGYIIWLARFLTKEILQFFNKENLPINRFKISLLYGILQGLISFIWLDSLCLKYSQSNHVSPDPPVPLVPCAPGSAG